MKKNYLTIASHFTGSQPVLMPIESTTDAISIIETSACVNHIVDRQKIKIFVSPQSTTKIVHFISQLDIFRILPIRIN